jgi:hypothetical protein
MSRRTLSPQSEEALQLARKLGIVAAGVKVQAGAVTIFDRAGVSVLVGGDDPQTQDDAFEQWQAKNTA